MEVLVTVAAVSIVHARARFSHAIVHGWVKESMPVLLNPESCASLSMGKPREVPTVDGESAVFLS